jgi:MFS transporter, DHA1 family, inner membrane transport protein
VAVTHTGTARLGAGESLRRHDHGAGGGVPLGAWLAYRFGWHAPFYLAAALAGLCALVLLRAIPPRCSFQSGNVRTVIGALGNARLMVSVTFTATLMAAVYVVFTYFGPLIEVSAGSNPEARTAYLVLFGLGAMGGNFLGGYLTDRVGPSGRSSPSAWRMCSCCRCSRSCRGTP